jgi:hypothetical protein
VDQPTRGADQNRAIADSADPGTDDVLLPSLEAGITLLDVEGGRGVPVIQSLVLDHLLMHDRPAFWVDANGHATTTTVARIAPSRRLLDRVHVTRGFTATQHYGAVGESSFERSFASVSVNRYVQATDVRFRAADSGLTVLRDPELVDSQPPKRRQ